MSIERTFGIVKPDAVAKSAIGACIGMIEKAGLRVVAMRMTHLTRAQAEGFYAVHKGKPFFDSLVQFMISGPCVLMAIEGQDAIATYRKIMGSTDSTKAAPGTIRSLFGTGVQTNAVHGSDGPDTARFELSWFFPGAEFAERG